MRSGVLIAGLVLGMTVLSACSPKGPEGMVLIPGGSFIMGTDEVALEEEAAAFGIIKPWVLDASPARTLEISAFYMDRFEVTNADFLPYLADSHFPPPPNWLKGQPHPDQLPLPVTYVSWNEAYNFCAWAGKRLPTEIEWEKAARGKDGWNYPWGFIFDPRRANVGGIRSEPAPVGNYPLGQSPYGVHDMIGNVWEWTNSWYQPFPGSRYANRAFGKRFRVVRGNSWAGLGHFSGDEMKRIMSIQTRATYRLYFKPNSAIEDVGFRCVQDLA